MTTNNFLPEKNSGKSRIRPLRTAIICVLIAVMLVSISVSMSYSKFTIASEPLTTTYQVKNYVLPSSQYVMQTTVANPTASYSFVSPDGLVKVLYSKESTDSDYLASEYLAAYFDQQENAIDYTANANQISLQYEIALKGVGHDHDLDMFNLKSDVSNEARGILVYISVGRDADASSITDSTFTIQNASSDLAITRSVNGIADSGVVSAGTFGQLYSETTSGDVLNSVFAVNYDKLGWADYADTAWYDSDSTDAEFWITSAEELAGLAKLVNDGTEDFSGKTIYLNQNINLADANGYLRRWTPIGTHAHPFKGSFDGQNKTISGLNVADFGAAGEFAAAGLFGFVDGTAAEIKNMTVSTAYLAARLDDGSSVPSGAIGTVVGWMENGTISGVTVNDANVCGTATYGGMIAGRIGAAASVDPGCQITGSCAFGSGFDETGELFAYQAS